MRFALIGNHPDGLALARAFVQSGEHELAVVCDASPPGFVPAVRCENDLEEVLADPALDWIIVAGPDGKRGEQLRRTVQSEHDAICVHPSGDKPDLAYEIALIAADTKRRVAPLLPARLHPAYRRLNELLTDGPRFDLLQWEIAAAGPLLLAGAPWDVLRFLGGEIVEVSGLAPTEEARRDHPLLIAGRFERGGLFQVTMRPNAGHESQRLIVDGPRRRIELDGPAFDGSATLTGDSFRRELFEPIDLWTQQAAAILRGESSWNDEVRALELQDALKRSVEKRRTSSLEFQEISEEVGSKGTLTLIGCSMIWIILFIFMLSIWVPWIRWAIVPLLLAYLVLLGMNWLARK